MTGDLLLWCNEQLSGLVHSQVLLMHVITLAIHFVTTVVTYLKKHRTVLESRSYIIQLEQSTLYPNYHLAVCPELTV